MFLVMLAGHYATFKQSPVSWINYIELAYCNSYIMYNHEQLQNVIIKNYEITEQIGEGVSARVYKAYNKKEEVQFAIKAIPKQYLVSNPKLYELVKNQIQILRQCNNQNIIKCYDVFQTSSSILIVTELCNGRDMEHYLEGKMPLSEDSAVFYLKQLINGFRGLHDVGVMHRDFKLANILIHNQVCKIADLGYAKKMEGRQITHTFLGTRITMAPEVLQRTGYGYTADIWSLGVVFYQMLFGVYPYQGVNQYDLLRNIRQKQVQYNRRRISNEAMSFIRRCLDPNQKTRLSWDQVYKHPLITKQHFEILLSIYNPVHALHKNKEFYKNNNIIQFSWSEEQTPNEELPLLLQSMRKKLIIEEIKNIIRKKMDKPNQKIKEEELSVVLYNYSRGYIHYFNKLASCFKFLRLSLIKRRSKEINQFLIRRKDNDKGRMMAKQGEPNGIELESLVYVACKKSYIEVLQFCKILEQKINIFQIAKYWVEFTKSIYYKQLKSTIQYNMEKIGLIMRDLSQYACLSQCQNISVDACEQDYQNTSFVKIWQTYLARVVQLNEFAITNTQQSQSHYNFTIKGVMDLVRFYKNDEKDDDQLRQFMEGLLYYLVNDEKSKLSPEQFDYRLGDPILPITSRQDLLERYDLFFNYM